MEPQNQVPQRKSISVNHRTQKGELEGFFHCAQSQQKPAHATITAQISLPGGDGRRTSLPKVFIPVDDINTGAIQNETLRTRRRIVDAGR